jgi:hypothetical protein
MDRAVISRSSGGPRHHFPEPRSGRVPGVVYKCAHCSTEMKILLRPGKEEERLYRARPEDAFSLRRQPCVYKSGVSAEVIEIDPPSPAAAALPDGDLLALALGEILADYHRRAESLLQDASSLEVRLREKRAAIELLRSELADQLSKLCREAARLDAAEADGAEA